MIAFLKYHYRKKFRKCQKRGESLSERDVSDDDYVEVTILSNGRVLEYVVPSFPIYKATLREMKLQWEEADGTIHDLRESVS